MEKKLNNFLDWQTNYINSSFNNNDKYFFIDTNTKSVSKKVDLIIEKNQKIKLFLFIINTGKNKKYEININQKNDSEFFCNVLAINSNGAITDIKLINKSSKNTINAYCSQEFKCFNIDQISQFILNPILSIKNNTINAFHSIDVGFLDKEKIFYLSTKKIPNNEIYELLFNSLVADINLIKELDINRYNKLNSKIKNVIKNYEQN